MHNGAGRLKLQQMTKLDVILRHSTDTRSNKPINIHEVNFTRLISKSHSAQQQFTVKARHNADNETTNMLTKR